MPKTCSLWFEFEVDSIWAWCPLNCPTGGPFRVNEHGTAAFSCIQLVTSSCAWHGKHSFQMTCSQRLDWNLHFELGVWLDWHDTFWDNRQFKNAFSSWMLLLKIKTI
jgi:hypothetical protein